MKFKVKIRAEILMDSQFSNLKDYVLQHGQKPLIDDLIEWFETRGILINLNVDVDTTRKGD